MISATVLGSGSRGNSLLIDGSEGSVLVDVGFGTRSLASRLQQAGREPEEVDGVLLTHEHVDHAAGASAASARWGWPVYASAGTLEAMSTMAGGAPARTTALACSGVTALCGFDVEHFPVPHDAADCRAMRLTDRRSGARVGIVLDAGHVPDGLSAFLSRLDLLVIESNHDTEMLAHGPYPRMLKRRISGGAGHLSNAVAASLAARCVHAGLRGVMLAHLSETNNTPELAVTCVREALRRAGWRRDALWASEQRVPHLPVPTSAAFAQGISTQLTLF